MAVNAPNIEINPYQSTVPLVQVPAEQMGGGKPPDPRALPVNYTKAGGKMAIGDALMKGFLQGHAIKEQKKYAQAQTELQVGQTMEQTAWKNYQDALASGKTPDSPEAKALYESYTGIYDKNTQNMQKYAVPEKKSKGGQQATEETKGEGGKKGKDDTQKPMSLGDSVKDFFAANPHLVPHLAMLTRKMGKNKPGPTPDTQANALKLREAQNTISQQDQAISDLNVIASAHATEKDMTPEQKKIARDAMPEADRKKLEEAEARRDERINEQQEVKGKYRYWTNGTDTIPLREGEAPPPGSRYHLVNERQQTAPKGEEAFKADYIRQNGLDPKNIDPRVDQYIHDLWQWKQPQTTSTTSGTTVDASGTRTTTGSTTRGVPEPKPPAGIAPIGAAGGQSGAQGNQAPSGPGYPAPAVPGNIQWNNRSEVDTRAIKADTTGTVLSASKEEDGMEVLFPRIYDGKVHSVDEAWQHYKQTGQHMGKFKSIDDANAYAKKYHEDAQAGKFGKFSGGMQSYPKQASGKAPVAKGPMTPRPGQAAAPKKQTRAEFVDAQKRDAAHDAGTKAAYKDYTDKLAALNLKSFATPADKEKAQKDLENAYNAKIQENERAFHKGENNPQGQKEVPPGTVLMTGPNGDAYYVPQDKVPIFTQNGYK